MLIKQEMWSIPLVGAAVRFATRNTNKGKRASKNKERAKANKTGASSSKEGASKSKKRKDK